MRLKTALKLSRELPKFRENLLNDRETQAAYTANLSDKISDLTSNLPLPIHKSNIDNSVTSLTSTMQMICHPVSP